MNRAAYHVGPRPKRIPYSEFHGFRLLGFEQWQRRNYEIPPRDAAESDLRYKRWILSFS